MERRKFIADVGRAGLIAAASGRRAKAAAASDPRLKIGQIGTTHAHADAKVAALSRVADFELVGVVEPDEQRRKAAEAKKEYQGVRWITEEQLFNTAGLRAVAVETPVK